MYTWHLVLDPINEAADASKHSVVVCSAIPMSPAYGTAQHKLSFLLADKRSSTVSLWGNICMSDAEKISFADIAVSEFVFLTLIPLRPNNDLSQTSHCNIKGLSGSEVMRI